MFRDEKMEKRDKFRLSKKKKKKINKNEIEKIFLFWVFKVKNALNSFQRDFFVIEKNLT